MSKVLYKIDAEKHLPKETGEYFCQTFAGRKFNARFISSGQCAGWWWRNKRYNHKVTFWYSDSPSPELAEVFENIQSQLTNIKENEPDDKIVRLPTYI